MRLKRYPAWVCYGCGTHHREDTFFHHAVYHEGSCGVCRKKVYVTHPKAFRYPKFEGFEKHNACKRAAT